MTVGRIHNTSLIDYESESNHGNKEVVNLSTVFLIFQCNRSSWEWEKIIIKKSNITSQHWIISSVEPQIIGCVGWSFAFGQEYPLPYTSWTVNPIFTVIELSWAFKTTVVAIFSSFWLETRYLLLTRMKSIRNKCEVYTLSLRNAMCGLQTCRMQLKLQQDRVLIMFNYLAIRLSK